MNFAPYTVLHVIYIHVRLCVCVCLYVLRTYACPFVELRHVFVNSWNSGSGNFGLALCLLLFLLCIFLTMGQLPYVNLFAILKVWQ